VKAVSLLVLGSIFFLRIASVQAGTVRQPHCLAKPVFENPEFEKREKELRPQLGSALEKPSFEKPIFEREKMSRPTFERLVIEKPVFQRECIESVSKKGVEEVKSLASPFPDGSEKKWGRIQVERRKLHTIPQHQLKIRKVRVFR